MEGLTRSVLYAMCAPIARLAFKKDVPLKELRDLIALAYFHETRRQGVTGAKAAERLGVSLRTITGLSRRLKDLLSGEVRHALPRRIEYLLWAESISLARLKQVFREDPADVEAAVTQLLAEGRVERTGNDRLKPTRSQFPLVGDDLGQRLDGLSHLLQAVGDIVQGRFFEGQEDGMARTYAVRVRAKDRKKVNDAVQKAYEAVRAAIIVADEVAHDGGPVEHWALTFTWGRHEMVGEADDPSE